MMWLLAGVVSLMTLVTISGGLLGVTGYRVYKNSGVSLPARWFVCKALQPGELVQEGTLVQLEPPVAARLTVRQLAPDEDPEALWVKQVVGKTGETICLHGNTVSREGETLAARPLLERYALERIEGCWTLRPQDIFVMGTHPQSYDTRYTGPWNRSTIHGTCKALGIWGGTP